MHSHLPTSSVLTWMSTGSAQCILNFPQLRTDLQARNEKSLERHRAGPEDTARAGLEWGLRQGLSWLGSKPSTQQPQCSGTRLASKSNIAGTRRCLPSSLKLCSRAGGGVGPGLWRPSRNLAHRVCKHFPGPEGAGSSELSRSHYESAGFPTALAAQMPADLAAVCHPELATPSLGDPRAIIPAARDRARLSHTI